MSAIQIGSLLPDHITPGEPARAVSGLNGDLFKVRAKAGGKGRVRFEVWHAFAWPQQPLTQTQWLVCATFDALVNVIEEHSRDQ